MTHARTPSGHSARRTHLRAAGGPAQTMGQLHPPGVLLALAILDHRPWCAADRPHVEQVRAALLGAGIDDLAGDAS